MNDLASIVYRSKNSGMSSEAIIRRVSNEIYKELQHMSEDNFAGSLLDVAVNVKNQTYIINLEIKQ